VNEKYRRARESCERIANVLGLNNLSYLGNTISDNS